jgi:hypothetical protein
MRELRKYCMVVGLSDDGGLSMHGDDLVSNILFGIVAIAVTLSFIAA